jgi:hypothetical protein
MISPTVSKSTSSTVDPPLCCRCSRQRMSNNEIDLSDLIEGQLDKPGAVASVIGWPDLKFKVVQLGIEKSEELRIRQENRP